MGPYLPAYGDNIGMHATTTFTRTPPPPLEDVTQAWIVADRQSLCRHFNRKRSERRDVWRRHTETIAYEQLTSPLQEAK